MKPNEIETIFHVTMEGTLRNYRTNASMYDVARCSENAKTVDDLENALREKGYYMKYYGTILHLHLEAPTDSFHSNGKLA